MLLAGIFLTFFFSPENTNVMLLKIAFEHFQPKIKTFVYFATCY